MCVCVSCNAPAVRSPCAMDHLHGRAVQFTHLIDGIKTYRHWLTVYQAKRKSLDKNVMNIAIFTCRLKQVCQCCSLVTFVDVLFDGKCRRATVCNLSVSWLT